MSRVTCHVSRLARWGLAVGIVGAGAADAAPVKVEARAEPTEAHIGEPIRYTLAVEHPEGLDVTWPAIGATLGDLAVEGSGAGRPTQQHGAVIEERWWRLSVFKTGAHAIPGQTVTSHQPDGTTQEARSAPVTITVKSLLPSDWQSQDIRDVKPLVPILPGWWAWGLGAGVVVAAGAMIWRLRRKRAGPGAPPPPPRPPHEIALEGLARLRQQDLPGSGRYEDYYVSLSSIVRVYVEGRFSLRAPEMTTEEFLQEALKAGALSVDHQQLLREFLARSDLVKFAQYRPTTREAEEAYRAAERFVRETMPALAQAVTHVS